MVNQLPQPRLVRTAHNEDGVSVFASDETLIPFQPFGPTASAFTMMDTRNSLPAANTDPVPSFANTLPRCPPEGVLFAISDYPGNGYTVPMHRTLSLDYAVVLSGEIVLELDGGEERTVRAGEFIIQQGTNHKWINRLPEPCRVLFMMVGARQIVLNDGTALEETKLFKQR
ncbi:hypothetical protein GQ53DRAFT_785128 [Thozetella sp. PMI_491]|nr:hypothetical protein GQ53DRAFT_785128 [Thozetella sp. PMI_491]